jgi:tyrosyl-tRNA synthetase
VLNLSEGDSVFAGFDPTADSLHVGNLLSLMVLLHFQRHGFRPIALVGGATGMLGDPSGKASERVLLDPSVVMRNSESIRAQIQSLLSPGTHLITNNAEWLQGVGFIEFMREVGKHFSVGAMLGKESVKRRLTTGLSFTEFSYSLLQSFDFFHLAVNEGCRIQVGGSDQWGNITSGIEFSRKKQQGLKLEGLVTPLVTSSNGEKFGKSVDGAVWLCPHKTSPFFFFQFWFKQSDTEVEKLLKFFTLLSKQEVEDIMSQHKADPHLRHAQRKLAVEVTTLIHGREVASSVEWASEKLWEVEGASEEEVVKMTRILPTTVVAHDASDIDILVSTAQVSSRREAKRLVKGGGASVTHLVGSIWFASKGKSSRVLVVKAPL